MFSSKERLEQRTPANGIDRREFIKLLVDEYYETTDVEAQQQVTANLANFSYDPLNYPFLQEAKAIDLFLELLSSPNPKLLHHGTAGLCNLCLDSTFSSAIVARNGIQTLSSLLSHNSDQIVQNVIATLLQLDTPDLQSQIFTTSNRRIVSSHRSSKNPVLHNLATVFSESAQHADLSTNSQSSVCADP